MTEPTPGPQHSAAPTQPSQPTPTSSQPTPTSPNQSAAPTPASVNGDVPVETWRRSLEQINAAPSAERHQLLSTLLDDLDSQVSSL